VISPREVRSAAVALRTLARRALSLEDEVREIDRLLKTLVAETAPELCAIDGVGTSAILVAAGDNPDQLKTEATFAKLRGVPPLDASRASRRATGSTSAETVIDTLHLRA